MNILRKEQNRKTLLGDDGNPLLWLIYINVTVFIILGFIRIVYVLGDMDLALFDTEIMHWFSLPADWKLLITRPWTLLTAAFTHSSIWQLIGNMFFLWSFGFLMQDLTGNKHLVPLYLYGSWVGMFFFLCSVNLLPAFNDVVSAYHFAGAGAAIMSVAIGVTVTAPNYRIFPMINGGIPIWVITFIFVLIDFAGLASVSLPESIAHLTGAGAGYVYMLLIRNGRNPEQWMHQLYQWFMGLFEPASKRKLRVVRDDLFYDNKGKKPFHRQSVPNQQKIDLLLEKIHQKGYDALTQEEKDLLKRAGESNTN